MEDERYEDQEETPDHDCQDFSSDDLGYEGPAPYWEDRRF